MRRIAALWLSVAGLTGCVVDVGVGSLPAAAPPAAVQEAPAGSSMDILFVIDNSGSMAEEQQRLGRTIFKSECPIQDLQDVPLELRNPGRELLDDLTTVCGFAQILAALQRDFRVGAITTDVNACDNIVPSAMGGAAWGFRPQRGCLQPVASTGQKYVASGEPAIAARFQELIGGIGTFGSPFERGLDAADVFLMGDGWVSPGCELDRGSFLRPEASLLLVFVADEDDCSHEDGAWGFADETSAVCGEDPGVIIDHDAADCRTRQDLLAPVDRYFERWRTLKARPSDVQVVVIGGGLYAVPDAAGDARLVPAGCRLHDSGVAVGGCFESGGLSNLTGPGQPCDLREISCCTAEAAGRYFFLAELFAGRQDSICNESYTRPIIESLGGPER